MADIPPLKKKRKSARAEETLTNDERLEKLESQISNTQRLMDSTMENFERSQKEGKLATAEESKKIHKSYKNTLKGLKEKKAQIEKLQQMTIESSDEEPAPKKSKSSKFKSPARLTQLDLDDDESSTAVPSSPLEFALAARNKTRKAVAKGGRKPRKTEEELAQTKKAQNAKKMQKHQAAKTTADWKFRDRAECVAKIKSSEYLDIRCLEPSNDILRNQAYLAGYLGLRNTEELEEMVTSVKGACLTFHQWREKGFDVPEVGAGSSFNLGLIVKELRKAPIDPSWLKLSQVQKSTEIDASDPCFDGFSQARMNRSVFPKAVWAAMVFKIIKLFPAIFKNSNKDEDEEEEPEENAEAAAKAPSTTHRILTADPDDFHAAYLLLRHILDFIRNKDGVPPRYGCKLACPVRYLTDQEYQEIKGEAPANRKDEAKANLAKEMGLILDAPDFDPDSIFDALRRGEPMTHKRMDEFIKDVDIMASRIKILEQGQAKKDSIGKVQRAPLSDETIKALLEQFMNNCEIVHDAFLDEDPDEDEINQIEQSEDVATAEQTAPDEAQKPGKENSAQVMEDKFYKLRAALSSVCADVPSYREAATSLGMDPDFNKLGEQKFHSPSMPHDPSAFKPIEHQVIAAAWMGEMEQSPFRGGLLALDCGLGKTSTSYMHIFLDAMKELNRYQKYLFDCEEAIKNNTEPPPKQVFDFRPTMVVGPPSTLDGWFTEYMKWWRGVKEGTPLIRLRIYYGTDRTLSTDVDQQLRLITLNREATLAVAEITKEFPADDPMSMFGVVWGAYDTNAARTLFSTKSGEATALHKEIIKADKERTLKHGSSEDRMPSLDTIVLKEKLGSRVEHIAKQIEEKRQQYDTMRTDSDDEMDLDDDQWDENAVEHNLTVFASYFAGLFKRVICDEGHKLKNCRTKISKAIDKLFCTYKWIVTATPMMNRVSDMLGYLFLFFRPEWLADLELLDDFQLPDSPELIFMEHTLDLWEKKAVKYCEKYQSWPLFLFDPQVFASLVNKGALSKGDTARSVLNQLLGRIQLRWTMASQIYLDNDHYYQPGASVPIFRVAGVELRMNAYERGEYAKIFNHFKVFLGKGSQTDSGEGSGAAQSTQGMPNVIDAGSRDMASHRILSLASSDIRFNSLLLRKKLGGVKQVGEWTEKVADRGFGEYFGMTRPTPSLPNYSTRDGVCQYLAGESVKIRYASKHIHMAMYGDEVGNYTGKVIFYVNWPHTQWGLTCFLHNLGLDFMTIWPNTTEDERHTIMRDWNNPEHQTLFLVLNARSASQGINLQGACHKIVILDMPENISTVIQIIGRVHRLGQKEMQYIWICCVQETYDQWIFANATMKMVAQMAGEADLEAPNVTRADRNQMLLATKGLSSEEAHDIVREKQSKMFLVQIEELIRKQLGSRCSRMAWRNKDLRTPLVTGKALETIPRRHVSIPKAEVPATPARPSIRVLTGDNAPSAPVLTPGPKRFRARRAIKSFFRGSVIPYRPSELFYDDINHRIVRISDGSYIDEETTWTISTVTGRVEDPATGNFFDKKDKKWYSALDGSLMEDFNCMVPGVHFDNYDVTLTRLREEALDLADTDQDGGDGVEGDGVEGEGVEGEGAEGFGDQAETGVVDPLTTQGEVITPKTESDPTVAAQASTETAVDDEPHNSQGNPDPDGLFDSVGNLLAVPPSPVSPPHREGSESD